MSAIPIRSPCPRARVGSAIAPGIVWLCLFFWAARIAAQSGDFTYRLTQSAIEITRYTGSVAGVTIPESIEGLAVTRIASGAFYGSTGMTSLTLGGGVTNIGYQAFSYCAELSIIILPERLNFIGERAFHDCSRLTGLYFRGNAPLLEGDFVFENTTHATVYYRAGATGWGPTFGGRPTAIWLAPPSYAQWAADRGLTEKYPDASGEPDDPDRDGLTNLQEMAAGTDPTNRASVLAFEFLARPGDLSVEDRTPPDAGRFALYFQSIPGKRYAIQSRECLGGAWTTAVTVTATNSQKRVLLNQPATQAFFRVILRP